MAEAPRPAQPPELLDESGNPIKRAPSDPALYVNFACEFGVSIPRMIELDYTSFRDETRENLKQMSDMILEQVLAMRKKTLAAKGRDLVIAPHEDESGYPAKS